MGRILLRGSLGQNNIQHSSGEPRKGCYGSLGRGRAALVPTTERQIPSLSWDRFTTEVMKRFGDNMALDEYEAFAATRHEGSLLEFVAAFEARLAQISDLSDHQYLGFFLAALRPDIRMHMKAANITSYSDAFQLDLRMEQVAGTQPAVPRAAPQSPQSFSYSAPPSSKGFSPSPSAVSTTFSPRPQPQRFRNMSSEEFKKHMTAGTCFRCGLKFGPSHRCPPKTLNVMVQDDDDSVPEFISPDDTDPLEPAIEL